MALFDFPRLRDELLHFSATPIIDLLHVVQSPAPDAKPRGLWCSVGSSWAEWCASKSFGLDRFAHATRVALTADANVLRLSGALDLDIFTEEYRGGDEEASYLQNYIRWDRVAHKYDGIIIAPYVWSRRLDGRAHRWYYGWDVASGCIWHPRAVASWECINIPDLSAVLPSPTEGSATSEANA